MFSFNRLAKSPKAQAGYFSYVDKVEATDRHTVVFNFNSFHAEWDYRFGWGYYSADLSRRKWPTPAPPTGRTATAPARSC